MTLWNDFMIFSNRFDLESVLSKHGKNSNEYEMAGGVRRSARKKPKRKTKEEGNANS